MIKPVILLPAAFVNGVKRAEVEAILAHELAHIKRYDCLVNFCQMLVEAILFFNPALWWVSRQIRIEREACCDAASVAITGRRTKYAEVLYEWAQRLSGQSTTGFTMTIVTNREVIFENPDHDFPQRIIYRLVSDEELLGRIEGTIDGVERAADFPMKKVDCEAGQTGS